MKYLLYTIDGFLKKFPLEKENVSIGREENNDIVIDDRFISRKHVDITVNGHSIRVRDAGSSNGILLNNKKVNEGELKSGDSFKVGDITFYLHSGDTSEFTLSEHFSPEFIKEQKKRFSKKNPEKTKIQRSVFKNIESEILQEGLKLSNFNEFISLLTTKLQDVPNLGALILVECRSGNFNIHLSINTDPQNLSDIKNLIENNPELFQRRITHDQPLIQEKKIDENDSSIGQSIDTRNKFWSEPLNLAGNSGCLIYFPKNEPVDKRIGIDSLLISLAKMIEILYKVMEEKKEKTPKKSSEKGDDIEIITNSPVIKNLIQMTKKIAASDVFVLIEGESGTGKELFARLIHRHSWRNQEKFIALNCAAIPENLLESELFGYEKGAFTGAYSPKKGKLEMASGGTLVLDEIGDMPINLQAKLLRALQELEFYRLGGSSPIKVNLRIISLTHQNLESLIIEKKFREDLFYRLVHRTITIPPLRERKEDIPALINYFTNKFCRQRNRTIGGYSIKAFEALVNFPWKGNIRELENEINSIVNLTDEDERVDIEILSEKIKKNYRSPNPNPNINSNSSPALPLEQPSGFNLKPERETIIEVLKKHNWNKSRAARDLNMTYHGLHKKMKKMGIKKSPGPG